MRKDRHWLMVSGLAAVVVLGFLAGVLSQVSRTLAQEGESAAYTIQVGGAGPGNIDALSFYPQTLQVHQGDSVTWVNEGFHNVRFGSEQLEMVTMADVGGQPVPAMNPGIVLPNIESGATYTGGDANSGLPQPGMLPVFSLVIGLEPGTYSYLCDIHPGMVGVLSVVDDATAIPSPNEAAMQGQAEFLGAVGAALAALNEIEASVTVGDNAVTAGSDDIARMTINQFFPNVTTIQAGESVTWTNPEASIDPHIVAWPPIRGQEVVPIEVEGGPPVFSVGPTLIPLSESGATVANGESFSSGLFNPGQSFSLTFSEPGVYPYACSIHVGMNGVVVVEPA